MIPVAGGWIVPNVDTGFYPVAVDRLKQKECISVTIGGLYILNCTLQLPCGLWRKNCFPVPVGGLYSRYRIVLCSCRWIAAKDLYY
jgi:hypothetical protein